MALPKSITSILTQMPRIPLNRIRENAVTLRTEYDQESLNELGDSMEDRGQIQPIIVQPAEDDWFDLIIGSRRVRGARAKGHRDIVAYVIEKRSPVELLLLALTENLHRADLNPFEEAQGFLRLMKEFGLSIKDINRGVSKSEDYIRRRLQLLSMPEEVVEMVSQQTLPLSNVKTLARLPTGEDQVRLARLAVHNRLTPTELSAQVRQELEEPPQKEHESYELTPLKVQARIAEFVTFLQKVPRRLKMRRMNAMEKTDVLKSLQVLEDEVRSLRELVRNASSSPTLSHPNLTRSHQDPLNHGEEWTQKDIKLIHSPRRPSDEELSVQLGRTISAIRAMRALTSEKA